MTKNFFAAVVFALCALSLSACSGNPAGPDPFGDYKGPKDGTISMVYWPPACLSAGTVMEFYCISPPLATTTGAGWANYGFAGLKMTANADGSFSATAMAPASPAPLKLAIYILDTRLCPPDPIHTCNYDAAGDGLYINGVKLIPHQHRTDSNEPFYFSFEPPTVIP